jgi:hypothetical protein
MSFLARAVVFWALVIAAISVLRLFPQLLLARAMFAHQGPLPQRGERRSRYMLRWAGYWGSWTAQCVLVFAGCWLAANGFPAVAESLWFLVLWIVVVPALGAIAAFACLVALVASAKASIVGPDPVRVRMIEATGAARFLER